MVRRSLSVALWSLVGLLACLLGALNALVGTEAGRSLLARVGSAAIQRAIAGTIEVGEVRGSLLTGVILTDVRIFDADTTLVAFLPRAELGYNPIDFAAGRVVFMEVRLDRPVINIVEHANGKTNFAELLRLGEKDTVTVRPLGPAGPRQLILLRNVQIVDGSLTLRLQHRGTTTDPKQEIEQLGSDGVHRLRRFERLNARLAALRIQAPRERGVRIDIVRLSTESSDPQLSIADIAGQVTIDGRTLDVDLSRVRFPASQFSARGAVRWPQGPLLWDVALNADSATLTDIRFVDPRFPAGAVLHGGVRLTSRAGGRVLEIQLRPLDLSYFGGRLTGRITAFSAQDSGLVALRQGDLVARDLSLELARPFLDTLPFAGRLTGRTVVDGPVSALKLETEWAFRDSLVPGWPLTNVRGKGEVNLAGADLAFQPFAIEAAEVDLGTVRRLVPAFALNGELDATGTLTGTLKNAQFSGTLRHHDGDGPASVVSGVIALDSRSEILGLFADVRADSLSLTGLSGRVQAFPLRGSLRGTIRMDGDLAALETHADLAMLGGGGAVRGDGILMLGAPTYGTRNFTLRAYDVDLRRWLVRGTPSRLTFTASGSVAVDSAKPPAGAVTVSLSPSLFVGTVIESGAASMHFADGRLYVDSLRVQQPGLLTRASGSLGWARPDSGTLVVDLDADSLSVLDSLVTWIAGPGLAGPTPDEALRGSAQVRLTLNGALDSLAYAADARVSNLSWRGWRVPAGRGRGTYQPGPKPTFAVEATLDSLGYGRFGFGAAGFQARGTEDSLTWLARSRVGDLGAFLAGGRYAQPGGPGAQRHVGVDSLAVLLPGGVWFLERPAELAFDDSTLHVDTLSLKNAGGPGRLTLGGELPSRGPIAARVALDSFPLIGLYTLMQEDTFGVAGSVTASVVASGTRANPTYAGSFVFADAASGSFRAPFMDGTLDYRARRLNGELHLWREGKPILDVTAHLPLDLALMDVEDRQLPDTLSVQARADSVDLGVLAAVTTTVRDVQGVFTADLGIGGTWERPRLRGALEIDDAAATIPALNVRYTDIGGRLALSGDTIHVRELGARSERGRAEVSGFVRLDRLTRPVLGLNISASEFKALELRGYLTLTASGEVSLTGPVFGATLAGRGTATSGVLHFADLVNKRVVNLDEPWVQDLIDTSLIREQRLGREFESLFFDSLRIQNLRLTMGDDVWMRSSEANIQLTGSVLVNKVRDQFLLSGTLEAPRGTYRLVIGPVTREFVVSRGTVRYFGTPDLDAELDIEARHVVHPLPGSTPDPQDIIVIAHIRGTLSVPKLTLEAEGRTDLSQTEVISYLIRGKPSSELLGGEFAFVQSAAASLIAGELERTFVSDLGVPIDYFEIRPGEASNPLSGAQFAAGWQIGSRTFLVLNAGGYCQRGGTRLTSTLGATFQLRLSPEWRTEASFEPVRSCLLNETNQTNSVTRQLGFDVFWEKRY